MADLTVGQPLQQLDILNPFVLRSVEPSITECVGRDVVGVHRLGKRIVIDFTDDLHIVIHLMIAGRLRWRSAGKKIGGKLALAAFHFPAGVLYLTEAGSTRRASIHCVRSSTGLDAFDRGGVEPLEVSEREFGERLRSENHTVKRSLSDPRLFSGIGNAYSDEILHRARLSPMLLTSRMTDDHVHTLFAATRSVLVEWTERLRAEVGVGFPEAVTAFRPEMAVHGRFGEPCPVCGAPVQRIRYAANETNYCARCQNGGIRFADRAMSRLLKEDWPRSLDELD